MEEAKELNKSNTVHIEDVSGADIQLLKENTNQNSLNNASILETSKLDLSEI